MATFAYSRVSEFNERQPDFTFEETDDKIYLKFGEVNLDDRSLLESIIDGGYVGFFQADREIGNARLLSGYHTALGLEVAAIPESLVFGESYEIRWTQARPGRATSVNVIDNEGVVYITDSFGIEQGIPTTFPFQYTVVSKRYERFRPRFYTSVQDFDADKSIGEDDPRYPVDISFEPPVPFQSAGFYVHYITFTAVTDGDLLLAIDLIEDETEEDVFDPADGIYLVDANGDYLVDANGDVLIEGTTDIWLVDADGDYLVDANGDWLVEG